jgi:hypothetical protein
VRVARQRAGVWNDLDRDTMDEALHQIRRDSKATPPIEEA